MTTRVAMPMSKVAEPIRRSEDFLVFGSPLIGDDEKREILDSLETGWLGTGCALPNLDRPT